MDYIFLAVVDGARITSKRETFWARSNAVTVTFSCEANAFTGVKTARIYELRNAHGTAGTLRLHRDSDDPNVPLKLTASIGPFGDAAAEKIIIDGVERRLTALHGIDATAIK